ncbi:MAG: hypothetical protein Q7S26_01165 [bacterium]|nr:hypothetical protein [bacterium]
MRLLIALGFLFAGFNMSGYDLLRLCRWLVGQVRVVEVYQDPSALTAIVLFLVWVGVAGWSLNQSRLALKSGLAWVGAIIGLSIVILFNLEHIPVNADWVVSFVEVGVAVLVAFAFTFPKIRQILTSVVSIAQTGSQHDVGTDAQPDPGAIHIHVDSDVVPGHTD